MEILERQNKLIVTGCSVSDYTRVNVTYGELLANKLSREYIHLAAGTGSNDRSIRLVTTAIRNEEITDQDILIFQITGYLRREFWSRQVIENQPKLNTSTAKSVELRENYSDGQTIKYKLECWKEKIHEPDKLFFKEYENKYVGSEYYAEIFYNQMYSLCSVLKLNNIKTIFVIKEEYLPVTWLTHTPLQSSGTFFLDFPFLNITHYKKENNPYLIDPSHFNNAGHIKISEQLYNLIKAKF